MKFSRRHIVLIFLIIIWSSLINGQCQLSDGFFSDTNQCDKYYECVGGVSNEQLCPDGLVFNERSTRYARCDLPAAVDCSTRRALQPAQPSPNCPRKWGFFRSSNPRACGQFYRCVDGTAHETDCPEGLVYSDLTGNCEWPDEAADSPCSPEEVVGFTCPQQAPPIPGEPHFFDPRYPHPRDCTKFYVCLAGRIPRLLGCDGGLVFNPQTSTCDEPINVPGC